MKHRKEGGCINDAASDFGYMLPGKGFSRLALTDKEAFVSTIARMVKLYLTHI